VAVCAALNQPSCGMDVTGSTSDGVAIRLSGSEALVLSDALHTWEQDGTLRRITAANPAAQRILFDLGASFEPLVDEILSANYSERLERARATVLEANS
jgi:hypothetical protein